MSINTKSVNTTIPIDYHKRAKIHGVDWTEALQIGIDILNNDSYHKEQKLSKEIKKLKGTLNFKEKRLVELIKIREEKEKLQKEITDQEKDFLKTVQDKLDNGAKLQAILNFFNNRFKKSISLKNFKYLLENR